MRIRIYLNNIIVFCFFVFYCSTNSFWAYRLFHENDLFAAAASLIPICLILLALMFKKVRIETGLFYLILTVYIVILASSKLRPKAILFYGMCFMIFLLDDLYDSRDMLRLFYYAGILFATGSMINIFLPGVYSKYILSAFSGSGQYDRLQSWLRGTYFMVIPGFANQTSFNACHFIYGIGYLTSKYFAGKRLKITEWGVLALFVICLLLTNKRGHFVFGIVTLVLCYYATASNREKGKRALIIVFAGLAALLVLYYASSYLDFGVFKKLQVTLNALENEEDITSGRTDLYAIALEYFWQKPFFGIGWDRYRFLPEFESAISTHNIYLQLLCETGIVGITVFLAFFLKSLHRAIVNCKHAPGEKVDMVSCLCLYMQLFFLLYGLTGNPLYDPPYYVPYFMMCAFTFSQSRWRKSVREPVPDRIDSAAG